MEEDKIFLSSLGVTSANPEDIERDVLDQATRNVVESNEATGIAEEDIVERNEGQDKKLELFNKLRAVEVEIDAIKDGFGHLERFRRNEEEVPDTDGSSETKHTENEQSISQAPLDDSNLQHALADDRLRSLLKRKAQLRKELSNFANDTSPDALIRDIVKDQPNFKRKEKEVPKSSNKKSKRRKTTLLDDDDDFDAVLAAASSGFVETERDALIRKGLLTPFHKLKGFERRIHDSESSGRQSAAADNCNDDDLASTSIARAIQSISQAAQTRPTTRLLDSASLPKLDTPTHPFQRLRKPLKIPQSLEITTEKNGKCTRKKKRPLPSKKWRKLASREQRQDEGSGVSTSSHEDNKEDIEDVEPPFVELEGGFKIPETIFNRLFDYQKVGVQWLWELHCQRAGGIIGDEMGLGKTIQVLSFLGSLHFSDMYKPSIIICPVTLLRQWKREAKTWYPSFHVEILHDSAHDLSSKKKQVNSESDYESEDLLDSETEGNTSSRTSKKWDPLIARVIRSNSGLLITTYEQLRILGEKLLDIEWGYAVLDEGHLIRNPNAEITIVCKQLQTVHRIIMTGAPIQNKLSELWSLFDFVFPGKLGVLPVFEAEFAVPITVGGYANATPLQVSTAYRCAVVLRDLIMPYLLRRMKADVNANLPKKTEHVLFCSLTTEQRSVYRAFLASSEVEQIFDGSRNSLYGIDVMRKICNHPDLLEREHSSGDPDYGNPERSGKMKVVAEVLKVWKEQGHRVLLFSQTQQMLDILERFLVTCEYNYRRMDGVTPAKQRMVLIDEFNSTDDIFIFILTTKVGGLGTNLTGANRVIIFDPDWNPSTDMQSAMNHDAIMNAHDEEKLKLEEQASQVAQRAAEALRQSRMLRSRDSVAVPTWTGKSGAAGGPSSARRKFGSTVNPQLTSKSSEESSNAYATRENVIAAGASAGKALSSAELLARIRGNREKAVSDGLVHQFGVSASTSNSRAGSVNSGHRSASSSNVVQPEVLVRQIYTFIQQRGGKTNSASIVDYFRDRVPSKDLPLFKNLLKEIAILEKNPSGSFWVLKPQYQDQ
ncbi:unnamed protein product [Withania somnifera]